MNALEFGNLAEALQEVAVFEKAVMQLAGIAELRGRGLPATVLEAKAWRDRVERIERAAKIFTLMIPHEQAIRSLDPLLGPKLDEITR